VRCVTGTGFFCDTFCSECLAVGRTEICNMQHGETAIITDRSVSAHHCRFYLDGVRYRKERIS
jgi:hypothetical protein